MLELVKGENGFYPVHPKNDIMVLATSPSLLNVNIWESLFFFNLGNLICLFLIIIVQIIHHMDLMVTSHFLLQISENTVSNYRQLAELLEERTVR